MNRHTLTVLGVVTVLGVGAALWSTQTRKPAQESTATAPLVPGLEAGINAVTAVRIVTPGNTTVATIERGAEGWTLREKGNYPVDTAKVRDTLVALAQARRVEAKTSSPALYGKLGVADIAAPDATGVQVEIDGVTPPVKLIVGQNAARGEGTFVRIAGEPQSWQADANIAIERAPAKWLQAEIVDVAPARIESVTVDPPEGATIEIVRAAGDGAAEFTLKSLPKGRELQSDFVADATAGLLSGLRLEDVAPADSAAPGNAVTTTTFHVEDGTTIVLTSWKAGDHTLARLAATLDEAKASAFVERTQARVAQEAAAATAADASAPAAPDATASGATAGDSAAAPATPTETPEQRLAAIRAATEAMQRRFAPWTYTIPAYKAGNLNKSLEDYLKPKG